MKAARARRSWRLRSSKVERLSTRLLIMAKKKWKENSKKSNGFVPSLPLGVKLVRSLRGHKGRIGRIAWSPDGRMLASGSEDTTIRLWNPETGECMQTFEGHKGAVWSVAFHPTGQTLASGSQDRTVKLW